MRFISPFLLVLPFVLLAKADYQDCTEYDEAHPTAWWGRQLDLAPSTLVKDRPYKQVIPIEYKTTWEGGRVESSTWKFDVGIDFSLYPTMKKGLITASKQIQYAPTESWKFNLLNKDGTLMRSYWLRTGDTCYVPSNALIALNGGVTVQYKIGTKK